MPYISAVIFSMHCDAHCHYNKKKSINETKMKELMTKFYIIDCDAFDIDRFNIIIELMLKM